VPGVDDLVAGVHRPLADLADLADPTRAAAMRVDARTDPDAVRAFVARHDAKLSGLTKREAPKHLRPWLRARDV
jgi:hypothetical protein